MLNLDLSKKYLLACSYGPDSMALLSMLLNENVNFSVALVNYNLRNESTLEMSSLIEFCENHNLTYFVKSINTKSLKGNVEENCRKIRYEWFNQLSKKYDFDAVLTGHHLDDLLETYLLQKNRKNLVKYFGIKEITEIFGVAIVRPLLGYSKKELLDYCQKNMIPYMIDKSNYSNVYKRNQIRHDVIEKMSYEDKLILIKEIEVKNRKIKVIVDSLKGKDLTNVDVLKHLSLIELQYALNEMVRMNNENISISKKFTKEIFKIIQSKKPIIKMQIINNLFLIKQNNILKFENLYDIKYSYKLYEPGILNTPYFYLDFSKEYSNRNVSINDFPLVIRNANLDDEIPIKDYTRPIKKLFVDWKMPMSKRSTWPIIENKEGKILYCPRYSPNFKVQSGLNFWVK